MDREAIRTLIQGTAQAEHAIIYKAIENFSKLSAGDRPPDAAQQFADIQRLLAGEIAAHFTSEEEQVFPALLANDRSEQVTRTIAALRQEHTPLLARALHLDRRLARSSLDGCRAELWQEMIDFFMDLEDHAGKEDQLFTVFA